MMKKYISMLVIAALVAVVMPISVEGQKLEVRLLAFDKFGRVVSGLKPENFRVKAGKDRPSISRLESEENEPIAVAFIVNKRTFGKAEAYLSTNFIRKANAKNEYCVISSHDTAEVISEWSSDPAVIESHLNRIAESDGKKYRSVVFDAAALAVKKLAESQLKKKVFLIFGNGYDVDSKTKLSNLKDLLRSSGVTVFGFNFRSETELNLPRDENMEKIAELTGGAQHNVVLDSGLMFDSQRMPTDTALPRIGVRQKPAALVTDPTQLLDEWAQRLDFETRLTYRIELSPVRSPDKIDFEIELRDLNGERIPVRSRFRLIPN